MDWYTEVFKAQEAQGLSAADLAALIGVTPTNIYYWRRRVREQSGRDGGVDSGQAVKGLVRIEVDQEPSRQEREELATSFEIRLENSRTIHIRPGFDPVTLQRIVTALEAC